MSSKPVQRSLAHLRKNGWSACVVERWIPPRGTMKFGVRIDAFGFGDLLACTYPRDYVPKGKSPTTKYTTIIPPTIALVQATDHTSFSKHKIKILEIPEFYKWKSAGGTVLLHGWGKRGPRGKRKLWTLREE